MEEFKIEFSCKGKNAIQTFKLDGELYELYVFCAKEFKCGIFSLIYHSINLNFVDKKTKLKSFIKLTSSQIQMKVIEKKQLQRQDTQFNIPSNKKLTIKNGEISNIILDKSFPYQNYSEISFPDDLIDQSEIFAFFLYFSERKIEKMKIPAKHLVFIDMIYRALYSHPLTNLLSLSVYTSMTTNQQIKLHDFKIKDFYLPNLASLKVKNANIEFYKPFNKIRKLSLQNAYNLTKSEILKSWDKLTFIDIKDTLVDNLNVKMYSFSSRIQNLDVIKIKFDSSDIEEDLNLHQLLSFEVLSRAKEIYLNLKSKILMPSDSKEITNTLRKIKELKLTTYSHFNEKDLKFFEGKMDTLKLFKLKNHNISNKLVLNNFITQCPKLNYVNFDLEDSFNENALSKFVNIIRYNSDILSSKIFASFSFEKIQNIILPCVEYSQRKQTLTLLGDMLPKDQNTIDNNLILLLKNILFSTFKLKCLTIKNFTNPEEKFLNKTILNLVNIISSPKIEKIKLINVLIDQMLIDKFSFIFMNSRNQLHSIEINKLKFESEDFEELFFSILFQIDYLNLKKIYFKNLQWNSIITSTLSENRFLNKIDFVSFESIENFDLVEQMLETQSLKGIELKNIKITNREIHQIIELNMEQLERLSFDLDFDILLVLNDKRLKFPKLKTLRIYEGFVSKEDRVKYDFLNKKWGYMKHLSKLFLLFKTQSNDKKNKMCALFKYLSGFEQ